MPNRIIRDKCRTSPSLDQLSHGAERFFWRLVTVADDFGRFEADPRVLLAATFPLKVQSLKVAQIVSWRSELISASLIFLYEHAGHIYGQFTNADAYFDRRAKTSKYPEPPSASICAHVHADSLGDRGSRHEDRGTNTVGSDEPTAFVSFWKIYPAPKGPKQDALKAFREVHPPENVVQLLMAQIAHKSECDKAGAFWPQLPHAVRWLKKRRWTDEIPTNGNGASPPIDPKTRWKTREAYQDARKAGRVPPSQRVPEWESAKANQG